MAQARHIRRNDSVLVVAGRAKGKRGRVLRMDSKKNRAFVEGVNLIKRHTKPNPQKQVKGGIVEKEAAVAISNLMVVCKECDKPSRVGYKRLDDGRKVRVCRRCHGEMEK